MSSSSSSKPDEAVSTRYRVSAPRAIDQWGYALDVAFNANPQLPDDIMMLLAQLDCSHPDRPAC